MTLLVQGRYRLSTRTGVVLGPDDRPVGRVAKEEWMRPRHWAWRTNDDGCGRAPTRVAALAALTAHLDKEAT